MGSARPSQAPVQPVQAHPVASQTPSDGVGRKKKKKSLLLDAESDAFHWPRIPPASTAAPLPNSLKTPCHQLREALALNRLCHRRQEAAGRGPLRHRRLEEVRRAPPRHRPAEAPPLTPPRHRRQEAAGRAPPRLPRQDAPVLSPPRRAIGSGDRRRPAETPAAGGGPRPASAVGGAGPHPARTPGGRRRLAVSGRDTRGWRSAAPCCDTGRGRRRPSPHRATDGRRRPAVPRRSILHTRDPQVGIRQGELWRATSASASAPWCSSTGGARRDN